jgi:heterodisulfide reductase subunit C
LSEQVGRQFDGKYNDFNPRQILQEALCGDEILLDHRRWN